MSAEDPAFTDLPALRDCRVAVVGLGLMGGSLALALRGRCRRLLGSDPDPAARELALARNAVDQVTADPAEIVPQADLVVLAAPVRAILDLLKAMAQMHPQNRGTKRYPQIRGSKRDPGQSMVLDLGSTKRAVVEAMQALPQRFEPLGGHPMCGREKGGLAAADAGLFAGRTFAFTALERTSPGARRLAGELAQAVGANAFWLDPATHDRWTAATSHLPYLAANALAAVTPYEAAPLAGSGFSSTTRVAASPPGMMLDVLLTNRENVLVALARFQAQLARLESSLAQGDETALLELLRSGAAQRERIISTQAAGEERKE
jgi:prephenate dehydrogenase